MLDLQQLETFRVVAVANNFSRAASQLGYHQSTVTFHIKSLERELGVRLFERERFSKSIYMTEVGRRIFDRSEPGQSNRRGLASRRTLGAVLGGGLCGGLSGTDSLIASI